MFNRPVICKHSASCNTTSKAPKYPFTFKHCHSGAAGCFFFSPLVLLVLSSVCVRSSSCSVPPAASWSRAAPERLSAAAWACSSIPGLVSHLRGCYTIVRFYPPALTEGRQGVPQVVGSSPSLHVGVAASRLALVNCWLNVLDQAGLSTRVLFKLCFTDLSKEKNKQTNKQTKTLTHPHSKQHRAEAPWLLCCFGLSEFNKVHTSLTVNATHPPVQPGHL